MGGQIDGRMDGGMDGYVDGWLDGWMDGGRQYGRMANSHGVSSNAELRGWVDNLDGWLICSWSVW